jgi:hypothetical protein
MPIPRTLAVLYLIAAPLLGAFFLFPLISFDTAMGGKGLWFGVAAVCGALGALPFAVLTIRRSRTQTPVTDSERHRAIGVGLGAAVLGLLGMIFYFLLSARAP